MTRLLAFYITLTADGLYVDAEGGLGHYEPAEDEHSYANGLVRAAGDIVMGRVMYEAFAEYWDTVDLDDPDLPAVEREFATVWRETPKSVASRGRPVLGPRAAVIEGDVVESVRRLKAGDGAEIMLACGADLLATLTSAGLVDRYRLLMTPTALRRGKPMFGALEGPLRLRLVGTRTFASGSVLLEYAPAGDGDDAGTDAVAQDAS